MNMKKTLRPSPTAILNPRIDVNFKAMFTQETEGSQIALKSFLSSVLGKTIKEVNLTANEPPVDAPSQMQMTFDVAVKFDDGERASVKWENVKFTVTQAEDRRIGRIRAELCTK